MAGYSHPHPLLYPGLSDLIPHFPRWVRRTTPGMDIGQLRSIHGPEEGRHILVA